MRPQQQGYYLHSGSVEPVLELGVLWEVGVLIDVRAGNGFYEAGVEQQGHQGNWPKCLQSHVTAFTLLRCL